MNVILYHASEDLFRDSLAYREDGSIFNKDRAVAAQKSILALYPDLQEWYLEGFNIQSGLPHGDYGQTVTFEFTKYDDRKSTDFPAFKDNFLDSLMLGF